MEYAKKILKYYLKMVWEKSGLKWDSDNDAEIDNMVENIIEEAVRSARED